MKWKIKMFQTTNQINNCNPHDCMSTHESRFLTAIFWPHPCRLTKAQSQIKKTGNTTLQPANFKDNLSPSSEYESFILRLAELVVVNPVPLLFCPMKFLLGVFLVSIQRCSHSGSCVPASMNSGAHPPILVHVERVIQKVGETPNSTGIVHAGSPMTESKQDA